MRYTVHLFDSSDNLVAALEPITPEYRRRANQATGFSFGVLAGDARVAELQAARHCILYRDGVEKAAGYITARDFSGNPHRIECVTNEALLRRIMVPRAWAGWNNRDLADAVRELLLGFKTAAKNTSEDWLNAVDSSNVDVLTWPGRVVLAKDANGAYMPHGYVTVQFDMGDNVVRYDLLRWAEEAGEAVRIKAQFRMSADGVNWGEWSAELSSVSPADYGVALMGSGRFIQVRMHLYTDDTTTRNPDGAPTGYSPMLLGVEVIARVPSIVTAGTIVESTGVILQGYTFNRENALRILQTWCEDHGFEFRVDSERRLHFAKQLGQAKDVLLRRTSTMDIQRLNDNADAIQNVVLCLGAGEGPAQLQTVLRDEESIAAFGEQPGTFEDTSCETMADLVAKGQAYLAKSAWPKEEFAVTHVPVWELEDFGLYDTVTVVDPLRGMVTTARVLDMECKCDRSGENVTVGLNTTLDNIIERIVKRQLPRPSRSPRAPGAPWGLTITPGIKMLRLRWSGQADHYIIEHSLDGLQWSVLEPYWSGVTYTHSGVEPHVLHYYRVRGVLGGQISEPAGPVQGASGDVELPDTDPPAAPQGLTLTTDLEYVGQITWTHIVATWQPSDDDTVHYLLRYRKVGQGDDQWQHAVATGTVAKLSPLAGDVEYEVQARAVDRLGNASDWCAPETTLTARDQSAPTISAGIVVTPIVNGLTVTLRPQSVPSHPDYDTDWSRVHDWDGAEVHVGTTADFTPDESTLKDSGKKQRFDILGLTPGVEYYVKARVFDTSDNYSGYVTSSGVKPARLNTGDLGDYHDENQPGPPFGLVTLPTVKAFALSWNAPGSGPRVDHYIVEYATMADGQPWSEWAVCGSEIRSTYHMHEGLDTSQNHKYRVRAVSLAGVPGQWSDEVVAGKPGKVSLSEDVVGKLLRGALAEDVIEELDKIGHLEQEVDDHTTYISAIGYSAQEVSSTVAAAGPDGTIYTTIDQLANQISLRLIESELKDKVLAAIELAPAGARIAGKRIVLDGDTEVTGDFRIHGSLVVGGTITWAALSKVLYQGSLSRTISQNDGAVTLTVTHDPLNNFIGMPYVRCKLSTESTWQDYFTIGDGGSIVTGYQPPTPPDYVGRLSVIYVSIQNVRLGGFDIKLRYSDEAMVGARAVDIEWLRSGIS